MGQFSQSFIGRAASDNGEPSSKRTAGLALIGFAMFMEFLTLILQVIKPDVNGLGYDVFITLLASGLGALGISQFGKIQEHIAKNKKTTNNEVTN